MRKTFTAALGVALVAGLAWSALGAGAADRTSTATLSGADAAGARAVARRVTTAYTGAFKRSGEDTKITIKVNVRDGKAKSIRSMRYRRLPADCPKSANNRINGGWRFTPGASVNAERRFKITGNDGAPPEMRSTLSFRGKFSRNFNRVRGKLQTTAYFPEGDDPVKFPEEICGTAPTRYGARR